MTHRSSPPDDGLAVIDGHEGAPVEPVRTSGRQRLVYLLLGTLATVAVITTVSVAFPPIFNVIWIFVNIMRAR
jgi:hypothetical protein